MIDLFGNRHNERHTYRTVFFDTWQEGAELGSVTGGNAELSDLSDLKTTCSFSFKGEQAPDPNNLVRVYYSFDDDAGEHAEYCMCTCFAGFDTLEYTRNTGGVVVSGSCDGWSVLKVAQDALSGEPLTIPAGTNAIEKAVKILEGLGLRVHYVPSAYTTESDHTFDAGDSWLTICNWLTSAADYKAATPDAYGVLQLAPRVDPTARAVGFVFKDDARSIMHPTVKQENDWQSTPNVVRAYYDGDDLSMWATACNISGARTSLDQRGGREITELLKVDELAGATLAEKLADLEAKARAKLLDVSGEVEHVSLSHPYVPVGIGEAVEVSIGGASFSGNITNQTINFETETKTDTEFRRFISSQIEVSIESGITAPYAFVEWVGSEFGAGCCVELPIAYPQPTMWTIDAEQTYNAGNSSELVGTGGYAGRFFGTSPNGNWGFTDANNLNIPGTTRSNIEIDFAFSPTSATASIGTHTATRNGTSTSAASYFLFGGRANDTYNFYGRIYSAVCLIDGSPRFILKPAVNLSTGVAGLLDTMTFDFYPSVKNAFTHGEVL